MASLMSFGDASTMTMIAYRLGRAFTNGRKSAPVEFQEVENQLYALSTGLESFKEATDKGEIRSETNIDPDNDPITLMLANCNETLSHLDNLVTEYGSLSSLVDQNADNEPTLTQKIKQNWQTIQWTTEGGDLATLRRQLILHTNSLSLVLAPVNNTRTAGMSTQVSESAEILQQLYQLFLTNSETSDDQVRPIKPGVEAQNSPAVIYFKLQTDDYICSRAALQLFDLSVDQPGDVHSNLFQCHCSQQDTPSTQTHADHVSALTLSPSSFPVRFYDCVKSWIIYNMKNRDTHQLQDVTLLSLDLKSNTLEVQQDMSRFEEQFVDQLALRKARELLQQGMNTILPHVSLSADNVRLLHGLGHTSTAPFIDSVTLLSDKGSLTQDTIVSVDLFHYKSLQRKHIADNVVQPSQIAYDNYFELVFHYKTEEGKKDISKSIVYVEWSTDVKLLPIEGEAQSLKIGPVRCASFTSDHDEESIFDGNYVVLSFRHWGESGGFYLDLARIQIGLFVICHKYPRSDESLLLRLQADEISCGNLHIENGIIEIAVSRTNNQHRLIMRSEDGYVALSQEVHKNSISSLGKGATPDLNAETCKIWIEEQDGAVCRRFQRSEKGLGPFRISIAATSNSRLLELGLLALAGWVQDKLD